MTSATGELNRARVDRLYGATLYGAAMNVAGSALVAAATPSPMLNKTVVLWVCATVVLLILRIATFLAHRRYPDSQSLGWAWAIGVQVWLSGAIWGLGVGYMAHVGNDRELLVAVCMGLGAAMMTLPTIFFWPAYIGYHASLLMIAALGFATSGRPGHVELAIASLLLFVALGAGGRRLANALVDAISISVENAELADQLRAHAAALQRVNQQLEALSRTDALTGVANRRWFLERLGVEWAHALETGQTIGFLAIDVDYFKAYNDTYGHAAGDACLQAVADALARYARDNNAILGRQGGEEFGIIMMSADRDAATRAAADVCAHVRIATCDPARRLPAAVTVSIGVDVMKPHPGAVPAQLMERADAALYQAKSAGRDGYVVATQGYAEDSHGRSAA